MTTEEDDTAKEEDINSSILMIFSKEKDTDKPMTQPRKKTQTHTDDTAKEKDTDTYR